jgi:Holliday junction resolvase
VTASRRNNRARGDYFERQARHALEARGWFVIRSAGSFGIADLVALREGNTPMLVSCKLSGRIGPAERHELLETARTSGARAVVAMRPRAGRVMLATVVAGTSHLVPIDTLPVPPKMAHEPLPPRRHDDDLGALPDRLLPAGVQLTLPTE